MPVEKYRISLCIQVVQAYDASYMNNHDLLDVVLYVVRDFLYYRRNKNHQNIGEYK